MGTAATTPQSQGFSGSKATVPSVAVQRGREIPLSTIKSTPQTKAMAVEKASKVAWDKHRFRIMGRFIPLYLDVVRERVLAASGRDTVESEEY
jgi:hypothetical protein